MNDLFLPNYCVRCDGHGSEEEGWREGCDVCLRRLATRPERVNMIEAPRVIAFECPWLIEKENER